MDEIISFRYIDTLSLEVLVGMNLFFLLLLPFLRTNFEIFCRRSQRKLLIKWNPPTQSCLQTVVRILVGVAFPSPSSLFSAQKEIDCDAWLMLCWRSHRLGHPHPSPGGFFTSTGCVCVCVCWGMCIYTLIVRRSSAFFYMCVRNEPVIDFFCCAFHFHCWLALQKIDGTRGTATCSLFFITCIIWQLLAMGGWVEDSSTVLQCLLSLVFISYQCALRLIEWPFTLWRWCTLLPDVTVMALLPPPLKKNKMAK